MTARDYDGISSVAEAKILVERLMDEKKPLGFDVETGYTGDPFIKRSLDVNHAAQFVCGFSVSNDPSWARYLPLRHDASGDNLPPLTIWEMFRQPLETLPLIAHHKKFEDKNLLWLPNKGDAKAPIRTLIGFDTMIEAYTLGRWKESGLKFLSNEVLGVDQMTLSELFAIVNGKEMSAAELKKMRFNVLPVTKEVIDYGCDDSALAVELHQWMEQQFAAEPQKRRNILRIEMEISAIMADVELYGAGVDWEGMHRGLAEFNVFKDNMHEAVLEEFGKYTESDLSKINFGSAPQMRKLLYQDMGLSTTRVSAKTKEMSTDKIALEGLQKTNTAVKKLLESREVGVMGNRFKKWINEASNAPDKRAHASYSQITVPTGRFAASDPAIQQLPKVWFWTTTDKVSYDAKNNVLVNPEGLANGDAFWYGNFRDLIVAAPGHYLLTYDVSQGELRVLAGVSQEQRLVEAYANDEDVHILTSAMMLDKAVEDVTKDDRQIGKALPNDEWVLTPEGWVQMGELAVGDTVSTPSGHSQIFGVYPQGVRKTYTVTTTDGGAVVADAEHLWKVESHHELKKTTELVKGDVLPTAVWEPAEPVIPKIDPYSMGVLLAGASFTGTAIRMDLPVDVEGVLPLCHFGEGVSYRLYRERNRKGRNEWVITAGASRSRENSVAWSNPLERDLKDYGLRFYGKKHRVGVRAENKRIPFDYFDASAADRLNLLRGMLDVRGVFNHSHSVELECPSMGLAKQVQELVWSLGGRAKISTRRSPWAKSGPRIGATGVWVHISIEATPFRLPWKAGKWDKDIPTLRTVESVVEGDEKECTCIALMDEEGLFIAGDYIVTHNTMNFALLYQMGVKSLSERLAIPLHRAEELYARYFQQFTSVNSWIEGAKRDGMSRGYAETFLGRREPLAGWDSTNWKIRSSAERASVNYPIQGGLADIVKLIMIRSANILKANDLWMNGVGLTMNQHDALTFEVRNDLHPQKIRTLLEEAASLSLPGFPTFVLDWQLGQRWGSSVDWKPGEPVYQDENGDWHVGSPDTVGTENEPEVKQIEPTKPVEPVFTEPPQLHVIVDHIPTPPRLKEFFGMVKSRPGDVHVTLFHPTGKYEVPVTTSLSVKDAPRISLALEGAIVRVPENSASLVAVGAEIDFGGV